VDYIDVKDITNYMKLYDLMLIRDSGENINEND